MTERVRRVAERIRQELGAIDRVVRRAGRAMTVARERPEDQNVDFPEQLTAGDGTA